MTVSSSTRTLLAGLGLAAVAALAVGCATTSGTATIPTSVTFQDPLPPGSDTGSPDGTHTETSSSSTGTTTDATDPTSDQAVTTPTPSTTLVLPTLPPITTQTSTQQTTTTSDRTTTTTSSRPSSTTTTSSTTSSTTTSTSTSSGTTGPEKYAMPGMDAYAWSSPSGNLLCEYFTTNDTLTCTAMEHSIPPVEHCVAGQPVTVTIEPSGVHQGCRGDMSLVGPVLDYGQTVKAGPITCESTEQGMICDNGDVGFRLSRSALDLAG